MNFLLLFSVHEVRIVGGKEIVTSHCVPQVLTSLKRVNLIVIDALLGIYAPTKECMCLGCALRDSYVMLLAWNLQNNHAPRVTIALKGPLRLQPRVGVLDQV